MVYLVAVTRLPFYYRLTQDMRITVRPDYLAGYSRPEVGQFVFGYAVRIENIGDLPAQLMMRHWIIRDSIGEITEVEGEGVVGEQPVIPPGTVHEYESFCILKSRHGTMEGTYEFVRPDQSRFTADIPRFELAATADQDTEEEQEDA